MAGVAFYLCEAKFMPSKLIVGSFRVEHVASAHLSKSNERVNEVLRGSKFMKEENNTGIEGSNRAILKQTRNGFSDQYLLLLYDL